MNVDDVPWSELWCYVMGVPVKKYTDDPTLSWEQRYAHLKAHHIEETMSLVLKLERARARERDPVWTLEHRTGADVRSCTLGVFSSFDYAMEACKKHMDMLSDERSWFCLTEQLLNDTVLETSPPLVCIDRAGHISWDHQPAAPPFLLTTWTKELPE